MNNNNLTQLKLRVEHIVSYITYSSDYQYKIVQSLVTERVLEIIKDKESVTDEEITTIAKDLIFKHSFKFKRNIGSEQKTIFYLLNTLRKFNYDGELMDRLLIEDIVRHALLEFPITNDEMERTIIAIAQYEFDREQNTYTNFKEHLLKSKLMKKVNVPLKVFEAINERFVKEYGHLFESKKKEFEIDYKEIVEDILDKETKNVK